MDEVVRFKRDGAIGIVIMEDREYKNTFTHKFVMDLKNVFEHIKTIPELKVIVIHGFDNYFCCGGTQDELINLYKGVAKDGKDQVRFDDLNFHDLLLQCDIPVISAMQGHALGGGLAFGSFADIIVMAEESVYSAIFMKYGFTPGFGSTYILPKKYGDLISFDMLYSANTFYGEELKQRGISSYVVKKKDVIDTAMSIAGRFVDKSTVSLKLLKKHLSNQMRMELPRIVEMEVEMHKISFSQPEVLEKIKLLFGN